MIDDLFETKIETNPPPRIGYDNILTEVFPKDLREYSKIILEGHDVGVFSQYSDTLANLLPSNVAELDRIDLSKALFSKEQVTNLLTSLNVKIDRSIDFRELYVARSGELLEIDYNKLSNLEEIAEAAYIYDTINNAVDQGLIHPPFEYAKIIDKNSNALTKLLSNSLIIRSYINDNINQINDRFF